MLIAYLLILQDALLNLSLAQVVTLLQLITMETQSLI